MDGWKYRILHVGKPAFQDGSYLDKLTLPDVTFDDSGTYVCVATNTIGYNYREAYVQVYAGQDLSFTYTM